MIMHTYSILLNVLEPRTSALSYNHMQHRAFTHANVRPLRVPARDPRDVIALELSNFSRSVHVRMSCRVMLCFDTWPVKTVGTKIN
jgi:hypothetical protein